MCLYGQRWLRAVGELLPALACAGSPSLVVCLYLRICEPQCLSAREHGGLELSKVITLRFTKLNSETALEL